MLAKRRLAAGPPLDRATALRRLFWFLGVTTVANVVIGSQLSYRAVEHMETTQFCGQSCHVMKPEFTAHAAAPHSKVPCVSCHVSPGATGWVQSKINGTRQLYQVATNSFHRPIPAGLASGRLVASEETCESCHARETAPAVRLEVIPKRADDEASSATWTVLDMRVAKIHAAHMGADKQIRYSAADATRASISRIDVTLSAGTVRSFFAKGATADSVAALPTFPMQCVDCHNRPAHTFERPGAAVDRAIASGDIPSSLPFIKKQGVELLQADYADENDARTRIASGLATRYGEGRAADVDRAAGALFAIWSRNVFPDLKVTWGTYPNHLGHEDSPGCFRCHDGEHATADGAATIDQDCTSCHEPLAVEEPDPPILKTLGITG
jgi:nitrate/TMAO reductase-like tetraheme cytochrome c subunit